MDKYLAGGITLFAGLWGAKSLLKKRFGSESKREALNRAKGLNQMIDIDLVFENKFDKNNPIYRRFTFGKLNNVPESAEYKYAYVLPLTKSGKLRSNGKIHVAGIYPSENNEKFKIQELMCGQGDHLWIETDDFSKFKPMFYPVRLIEKTKKARRANYRNEIGTGNYPDLEVESFYNGLEKHDIMCKKCAKAVNNYHKGTFFYNQKGVVKESESKREALNRAKGLNKTITIETIKPKGEGIHAMSSDRVRKYTFGKLENVPMSATEKHLFYLPLKKDDKLRANGKIHMGWLSYPNPPDLSTIWAGKLCQGDYNWDEIDIKDFKDKFNFYYPVLFEEFYTDRYGMEREIVIEVQNDKNAHEIYRKLLDEGIVCKKCQEEHPLYSQFYFFNPKGQILESESKTNSELQKHFDILDKGKKEESIGELVDWDRKPKEPAYFEDVEWGQNSDD